MCDFKLNGTWCEKSYLIIIIGTFIICAFIWVDKKGDWLVKIRLIPYKIIFESYFYKDGY